MRRHSVSIAGVALIALSCLQDPTKPFAPPECVLGQTTDASTVAHCLLVAGLLSTKDRDSTLHTLSAAAALRDSFRADTGSTNFYNAAEIDRSLTRVGQFYSLGLFPDSVRFHRMLDHVLVTMEYVRGNTIQYLGGRLWPATTPWLSWAYYPDLGIYFQPVNTIDYVSYLSPRLNVPTDSVVQMAEHLYRYALWRTHNGVRFPVWEYEFTWTSGGVTDRAPWISGLAQGYAVMLFSWAYQRTGDPLWRTRAYEALQTLKVTWDDGGVMLPDTSHGYWWEEFNPAVRVWNGFAQAALGVGYMAQVTGDPEVARMFQRSIEAIKYHTHEYDTGTWTLYSHVQGFCTIAYHHTYIDIMDTFYGLTGDQWFKDLEDRWRSYVPPPGVG